MGVGRPVHPSHRLLPRHSQALLQQQATNQPQSMGPPATAPYQQRQQMSTHQHGLVSQQSMTSANNAVRYSVPIPQQSISNSLLLHPKSDTLRTENVQYKMAFSSQNHNQNLKNQTNPLLNNINNCELNQQTITSLPTNQHNYSRFGDTDNEYFSNNQPPTRCDKPTRGNFIPQTERLLESYSEALAQISPPKVMLDTNLFIYFSLKTRQMHSETIPSPIFLVDV